MSQERGQTSRGPAPFCSCFFQAGSGSGVQAGDARGRRLEEPPAGEAVLYGIS